MYSQVAGLRASISIQQCRRLGNLFSVLAAFALEGIVSIAICGLVEGEQLSKGLEREMPFGVFLLINDGRR